MGNRARKKEQRDEPRKLELPPCEQAQADGVPCTEVGRHCEICERAMTSERRGPPEGPGGAGTSPVA